MHSTLIKIGPLAVKGYGLMLFLSFFLGVWLSVLRARRVGLEPERVVDLAMVILASSVIGSRLFYVVFHWWEFTSNPWDVINPFRGSEWGVAGLSMFGGVVLALACSLLFLWRKRLRVLPTLDVIAPAFPLGIFLTRIGCFLNGCCFGKPCSCPWAIVFPADSPPGSVYPHASLHPAQLYASLCGLIIFLLVLYLERFKRFDGFTTGLTLLFYCPARFGIDFVRHYEESMILFRRGDVSFTVNQILCGLIFVLSLAIWLRLATLERRKKDEALDKR